MKLEKLTKDLEKILLKLGEVLSLEKSEINRDSAIKRFEISFDIAWLKIVDLRNNTAYIYSKYMADEVY